MKNKPLIIAIIILILAVLVGGYFFMKNKPSNSTVGTEEKIEVPESSKKMSLKDLMDLGKSQMCTFKYSSAAGTTEGTSYVANGKVRTDFKGTDPQGKPYSGGVIMDTEFMYSWNSQMSNGIKMPVSDAMEQKAQEAQEQPDEVRHEYVNPDAKVDYNCSSWSVDESKFTPPSTITFTDISSQMEILDKMKENSTGAMDQGQSGDMRNACSACDSLTGDAKAACKQGLGC
jgi:hypothetical protein